MTAAAIIREAQPGDLEALVELLGLLFALESDFAVDAARQRRGLAKLMAKSRNRLILVAERAGAVVGMATAQALVSTAEGGPALLLEDVVVRPEARGQGVGRALLARLEAWGQGLGATRMQLLADTGNAPAFEFYRACGFHSTNLVCLRRSLPAQPGQTGK
jgi:GNAT superfamily N-acetyltransferase